MHLKSLTKICSNHKKCLYNYNIKKPTKLTIPIHKGDFKNTPSLEIYYIKYRNSPGIEKENTIQNPRNLISVNEAKGIQKQKDI